MPYSFLEKPSEAIFKSIVLLFIALLVFGLYGPSLKNGFAYDDERIVINNSQISSLRNIPKAFSSCIWEPHLKTCKERTNYYRPLHTLSIMLTYAVSPKPFSFHLVNIVYYIILNFFVFLLLNRIFKDRLAALLGLFLFLLHPVHTEEVMWISAVTELLLGIFSILMLMVYISGLRHRNWLAAGLFFLALLSKETAIVLLPIIILYDYLQKGITINKKTITRYIPYAVFLVLYVVLRISAIGFGKKIPYDLRVGLFDKLTAMIIAFGLYLKKIFWPYPLSPFISINQMGRLTDYRLIAGALVLLLFAGLAIAAILKRKKALGFGLAFYAMFLVPVIFSMFFVFVRGDLIIADRYLSLPLFGASLIFGYYGALFLRRLKKIGWSVAVILVFIVIGINWSCHVYVQNFVWKSSRNLYEHIHAVNTQNGVMADLTTFNLALIYEQDGNINKAAELYQDTLSKKADLPLQASEAANQLGLIYLRQENNLDKSALFFRQSLTAFPYNAAARRNLKLVEDKIRETE